MTRSTPRKQKNANTSKAKASLAGELLSLNIPARAVVEVYWTEKGKPCGKRLTHRFGAFLSLAGVALNDAPDRSRVTKTRKGK